MERTNIDDTVRSMLTQVAINRNVDDPRNAEVLDVLEELARGELKSAANAAVSLIRRTEVFHETLETLPKRTSAQPAATE